MTRQITNTIENRLDTYNMVLKPETVNNLRSNFRYEINDQLNNSVDHNLPYVDSIEEINSIDSTTIIQINETTTSEQRTQILQHINDFTNSEENRMLLIENSSDEVKKYLKDLLIRASSYENISQEQLYTIANIIIYTMGNIPEVNTLREILEPLRNTMFNYDRNQIMEFILQVSPDVNRQIEEINLATHEQVQEVNLDIEQKTQENNNDINHRIFQNRQRFLMYGGGMLTTMALGYAGMPYLMPLVRPALSVFGSSLPSNLTTTALIPSNNAPTGVYVDILSWKEIFQEVSKKAREFLTGCL